MNSRWHPLKPDAQAALTQRDYGSTALAQRLATSGVEAGEIAGKSAELQGAWIPGVEIFGRSVFVQRHRGFFGEFARQAMVHSPRSASGHGNGRQHGCSPARPKGFHIHPPHIPDGTTAEPWFRRLFVDEPVNFSLRPYDREQWDAMFFVQGNIEMILVDERAGLERRVMRFLIEGDDARGPGNVGVVIPAGVAHALRVEGSRDAIMVYGTTTQFDPTFEGRIADGVERAPLPEEWERYLNGER
jgi:dTDP-4-dehydrorhamnose 3,5-epimerase-like enzyme